MTNEQDQSQLATLLRDKNHNGHKLWGGQTDPAPASVLYAGVDSLEVYVEVRVGGEYKNRRSEIICELGRLRSSHGWIGNLFLGDILVRVHKARSVYRKFPTRISRGEISLCFEPEEYYSAAFECQCVAGLLVIPGEVIALHGPAAAYVQAQVLIRCLDGDVANHHVSRADLFADLHIPGSLALDYIEDHKFQYRKTRCSHEGEDGRLDTYRNFRMPKRKEKPIRRSKLERQMVLYDKLLAMARRDSGYWITGYWADVPDADVWRVEFRHFRPFLKKRGVHTVQDLQEHAALLWDDASGSYFSLRDKKTGSYVPAWEVLRSAPSYFAVPGGRTAFREPLASPTRAFDAYPSIYGYLASIATANGTSDFDDALEILGTKLRDYHTSERWLKKLAEIGDQRRQDLIRELRRRSIPPANLMAEISWGRDATRYTHRSVASAMKLGLGAVRRLKDIEQDSQSEHVVRAASAALKELGAALRARVSRSGLYNRPVDPG